MDRNDRARPRRDGPLDLRGIDGEVLRLDVDKHRARAHVANSRDSRDEREWHRDDFITRPDARRQQRQMERARARVHAHGFHCLAILCEVAFECRHLFAKDELRTVEHAPNRGVDLTLDTAVLRLKICKWNHEGG